MCLWISWKPINESGDRNLAEKVPWMAAYCHAVKNVRGVSTLHALPVTPTDSEENKLIRQSHDVTEMNNFVYRHLVFTGNTVSAINNEIQGSTASILLLFFFNSVLPHLTQEVF